MNLIREIQNNLAVWTIVVVSVFITTLTIYEQTIGANRLERIELLKEANSDLVKKLDKSIEENDIRSIAETTASIVTDIYSDVSDEFVLKSETSDEEDMIYTSFYLEHKVKYPKYKYSLKDAYESSKLVEALSTYVATIQEIKNNSKLPQDLQLRARFEGSADKYMGEKHIGIYRGEYGLIKISDALVNGKMKNIDIYPGDSITNSELAFLRSYAVYKAYRELTRKMEINLFHGSIEFIANETHEYGSHHRYGKITVGITGSQSLL